MNKYKILIIENDNNSASDIELSLQNYEYQVVSINQHMSKVKNKLKNFLPDVVIVNNIFIMNPFFKTSKSSFLIPPFYDTNGNSFAPLGSKLFIA